jgi:hypothetical protein
MKIRTLKLKARAASELASQKAQASILSGYQDLAAGRIFASSGDYATDMETLNKMHKNTQMTP